MESDFPFLARAFSDGFLNGVLSIEDVVESQAVGKGIWQTSGHSDELVSFLLEFQQYRVEF